MKIEELKRLPPETQTVVMILMRIEKKLDQLLYGVEELEKENDHAAPAAS